jgi:hypothetical protein
VNLYDDIITNKFNRHYTQPKDGIYRSPNIILDNLTDREGLDKAYALEDKMLCTAIPSMWQALPIGKMYLMI